MAPDPPSRDPSTRWIETSRGILSYAQLAPLLGEAVLRVQQKIEAGLYASRPIGEELVRSLHRDFSAHLFPEWGGKYRSVEVSVGDHRPPPPYRVPLEMREYVEDLNARLGSITAPDQLPEVLAFAEGRLLSIHPFADFNGRLTRLWLWELLRRLTLPPVELAPLMAERANQYLKALRAADRQDWGPLIEIWIQRLSMSE